jgi:hypothetical protein
VGGITWPRVYGGVGAASLVLRGESFEREAFGGGTFARENETVVVTSGEVLNSE